MGTRNAIYENQYAGNQHVWFEERRIIREATPRWSWYLYEKLIAMTMAVLAAGTILAAPTVTDVMAKQRYPWNGLVDITCKVTGIDEMTSGSYFDIAAVMPDSGGVRECSHFWVVQNGTNSTEMRVFTNGHYQLLWDLRADLGQVRYSNLVVRVTCIGTKVQLWEGGPYWANKNIGADKREDYGYYFWWGDTVGYKRENDKWVAIDGSSSNFSFNSGNTPTHNMSIAKLKSEGWITADNVLVPEHDAAHVQWGGAWRMPTKQELDDLNSKCDWTWTTMNGVNGFVVKGKGSYASASIFLPAAGRGNMTWPSSAGSECFYWSSVPYSYDVSWDLYSFSGKHYTGSNNRYEGKPVRPVQGFTQ